MAINISILVIAELATMLTRSSTPNLQLAVYTQVPVVQVLRSVFALLQYHIILEAFEIRTQCSSVSRSKGTMGPTMQPD